MREAVYLDYAAGAPLRPEARAAMLQALDACGNPSSVHAAGRAARETVERARSDVAALVGARPDQVVFTGGGTEANNLAVLSAAANGARRLVVGATEHACVVAAAAATGLPVETWPVDADGVADLDWLKRRLARWDRAADGIPFVALMAANNETGVVQPLGHAAELVDAAGGRLHVDAVAAAGREFLWLPMFEADTLAFSAHKLGGPQGAGALVHANGVRLSPRLLGGGQEQRLRGGTENVAAIAGFGAAAVGADLDVRANPGAPGVLRAKRRLVEKLKAAGAVLAGEAAPKSGDILCLAAPGWPAHLQVMALDLEGVRVSAGAACSSGKVQPSPVLAAMGLGDLASCAIRASGGWATTAHDWDWFADVWLAAHARHAALAAKREYA